MKHAYWSTLSLIPDTYCLFRGYQVYMTLFSFKLFRYRQVTIENVSM